MERVEDRVEVIKVKHLPYGVVELRSDNILVFRPDIRNFKEYNLEILKDLKEHLIDVSQGVSRPYMADHSFITGLVSRKEKEFINRHMVDFANAVAIISFSPVMNVMLNSYLSAFKPKMRVKLFKSEQHAVSWLLGGS